MELEEFNKHIGSLRPELLAIATAMSGDDEDAEDTVQETLLRLWSMRDKLDSHPNPRALAISILKNIERDKWRHRQYEVPEKFNSVEPSAEDADPDRRDDVELIRIIIEHLPPLQSKIIRMKEIEGYGSDEIMKITGCTADSLRQNLSRARRRIKTEFIRICGT